MNTEQMGEREGEGYKNGNGGLILKGGLKGDI